MRRLVLAILVLALAVVVSPRAASAASILSDVLSRGSVRVAILSHPLISGLSVPGNKRIGRCHGVL